MGPLRPLLVRLLQATRLNRLAHRVYYRHVHGFESATPALTRALDRCFEHAHAQGLLQQGDYCEFGVFKGATLWHVQDLVRRRYRTSMRCFGFDSFRGLPDVNGLDRTGYDEFYAGQYACSLAEVRRMMDEAGTDWSRTFLIEGYFTQTLTPETARQHRIVRVAVALVDCDLYASTVEAPRFLQPRLCDRAIVIMDDWGCFRGDADRGQQRAMREFLTDWPRWEARPLFRYGSGGQVFQFRRVRAAAPHGAGVPFGRIEPA